jgi:hypothetical protein
VSHLCFAKLAARALVRAQHRANGRMRPASAAASGAPVDGGDPGRHRRGQRGGVRGQVHAEIAALQLQDSATNWAREALAAKNRLTAADAKLLEDSFEQKLSEFLTPETTEPSEIESSSASAAGSQESASVPGSQDIGTSKGADRQQRIDKSVLAVSAPRRYRNKEHLRFVTQQPCLLCARKPSDAHHLRFVQPRALGRKASDEFAVPLCRIHHRAVHRAGDERAWWKATGIDPLKVARTLWKDTLVSKPHDPVGATVHEPHQTLKAHEVDEKAP